MIKIKNSWFSSTLSTWTEEVVCAGIIRVEESDDMVPEELYLLAFDCIDPIEKMGESSRDEAGDGSRKNCS